jgi:anionic cell wall polymer biosynthesis LytR-Cps2A-Psr (LCP) family protein
MSRSGARSCGVAPVVRYPRAQDADLQRVPRHREVLERLLRDAMRCGDIRNARDISRELERMRRPNPVIWLGITCVALSAAVAFLLALGATP